MKIKTITSQHRRDFNAILECEHCNATEEIRGYDDAYFHQTVIPHMKCLKCDKKAPDTYRALAPKYPEEKQI